MEYKVLDFLIKEAEELVSSHRDELNEIKLRSLESWASAEALRETTSFAQRVESRENSKLDPVLAKQLDQISNYKAYLTNSLNDLERLLAEKRVAAKKKQVHRVVVYSQVIHKGL